MKRKYTSLMAACLMASMISTPILAADLTPAETSIIEAGNINLPSSFTDSALLTEVKRALTDQGVTNVEANVSQADLDKITELRVNGKGISTLRGITLLRTLKILNCSDNNLAFLDGIENLKDLEELYCSKNQLTTLNLAANQKLRVLDCQDNQLTSLDLSANKNLESLTAGDGQLSNLVLPGTTKPSQPEEKVEMERLYNPNSGEHFYTADPNEVKTLVKLGWKDEGKAWSAPKDSKTPVYRLYNPNAGDHHYTVSQKEKDHLIASGWKDEMIGWYSADDKGQPVYRSYNPNAKQAGAHHYTTSASEHTHLVSLGWSDEAIAWYGLK